MVAERGTSEYGEYVSLGKVEANLKQVQSYTGRMAEFTQQVQGQIMKREQDMKTQLALMKNTIAFALYIDETLQVDLTDPYTTTLLVKPVEVYPSGVTYSLETVEKREEHLSRKVDNEIKQAKLFNSQNKKREAIQCLKRKKMYEKQIEQIETR